MTGLAWRTRLAAVLLGSVLAGPAAADFDSGWLAFQKGEFAAAIAEWKPLADGGHPLALYNLGVIYDSGLGVGRDVEAARRYWTLAAESGLAEAQYNLALLLVELADDGVEVEGYDLARQWLQRSADGGFVRSQYTLGKMYAEGIGVEPDAARGLALILRAGEAGLVQAQYNLGKMYRDGDGVAADEAEANRWWRLAADRGYAKAQDHLAESYARGRGVAQDEVAALAWSMVAARQGHPDSLARESELSQSLAPGQVAAARELAETLGRPAAGPRERGEVGSGQE